MAVSPLYKILPSVLGKHQNGRIRPVTENLKIWMNSKRNSSTIEMECVVEALSSNVKFGRGATREVGQDCKNLKVKKVCVMTDKKLSKMSPVQITVESIGKQNINYKVYDRVRVEPTDESFKEAIDFAKEEGFDCFVAVGGGSVIDTCKAANLYSSNLDAKLLDYVNVPIGKGLPVTHALRPLIARIALCLYTITSVTTTPGTGSETTGTAVFDYLPMKAKTGITNRALRPTLGIVDPEHLITVPERVAAYSGIDVLCHAIESYTAIPFKKRGPRPEDPMLRPTYQGSNPISDIWSLYALKITSKYLKRAVYNADDFEAREQMHLASFFAGVGFGNAGCHLCHGMSYPISGLVRDYREEGYDQAEPLIPHGLSVVVSAPAVFQFTAPACPERHLEAAEAIGADVSRARKEDAGKVLRDTLLKILRDIEIPDGLNALGYTTEDVPALVKGAMPQHRLIKLSPRPVYEDDMAGLFEKSMKMY